MATVEHCFWEQIRKLHCVPKSRKWYLNTYFIGWRERSQQDATNLMFIIKLLSQHVSGNIIPIIRSRTVTFTVHTACVPALHNHSHHYQCRTPYAAVHTLVLLMMGIMMSETCWDKSLIINTRLVASCWSLSLHPTFMMHGHKSLKDTSLSCFRSWHVSSFNETWAICIKDRSNLSTLAMPIYFPLH